MTEFLVFECVCIEWPCILGVLDVLITQEGLFDREGTFNQVEKTQKCTKTYFESWKYSGSVAMILGSVQLEHKPSYLL